MLLENFNFCEPFRVQAPNLYSHRILFSLVPSMGHGLKYHQNRNTYSSHKSIVLLNADFTLVSHYNPKSSACTLAILF